MDSARKIPISGIDTSKNVFMARLPLILISYRGILSLGEPARTWDLARDVTDLDRVVVA